MTKRQSIITTLNKRIWDLEEEKYRETTLNKDLLDLIFRGRKENIYCTSKNNGKEYGYYPSDCAKQILTIMNEFNLNSIIDLGCGPGLLMRQVQNLSNRSIKIAGIDNEKFFQSINLFSTQFENKGKFFLKNLLKLETKDIAGYEAIYMYEPLRDEKLARKFVERLNGCITTGQVIIYNPAGSIGEHIKKSGLYEFFKKKDYSYPHVYIRK